jgi:glycosyltransferase involved in cell wall biosynthesis
MYDNLKVIAVMPAYNAAVTLRRTYDALMATGIVDEVVIVDDASHDGTAEVAAGLPHTTVHVHPENRGYGANQKTCYDLARKCGADIVAMVHPDYQYDPRVLTPAAAIIALNICDIVMGSRIRTRREALQGGMPLYKYICNRFLTAVENMCLGQNLGDFHSGFRVYRSKVLETIAYERNSDDFIFDTEFLAQAIYHGFRVGDVPIPARYDADSSSINFVRSLKYGLQCLWVAAKFCLQKAHLAKFSIFDSRMPQAGLDTGSCASGRAL